MSCLLHGYQETRPLLWRILQLSHQAMRWLEPYGLTWVAHAAALDENKGLVSGSWQRRACRVCVVAWQSHGGVGSRKDKWSCSELRAAPTVENWDSV